MQNQPTMYWQNQQKKSSALKDKYLRHQGSLFGKSHDQRIYRNEQKLPQTSNSNGYVVISNISKLGVRANSTLLGRPVKPDDESNESKRIMMAEEIK